MKRLIIASLLLHGCACGRPGTKADSTDPQTVTQDSAIAAPSCTVVRVEELPGAVISCPDGTSAHILDGKPGQSIQGPKGDTGPQGQAGINGSNGADGATGANGLDGTDGRDGISPSSVPGPRGEQGVQGAPGQGCIVEKIQDELCKKGKKTFFIRVVCGSHAVDLSQGDTKCKAKKEGESNGDDD